MGSMRIYCVRIGDKYGQLYEDYMNDKLSDYEQEDNTAGSQTLACSGDSCEIVDLV